MICIPIIYASIFLFCAFQLAKIKSTTNQPITTSRKSFSIIIPYHNESEYLKACIDSLLDQDYPKDLLEIIFINDHSSDTSEDIVSLYAKNGQIKSLNLMEDSKGKKAALHMGVLAAKHELIITTDADTFRSSKWVNTIDQIVTNTDHIYAFPVIIQHKSQSILSQFQTIEYAVNMGVSYIAAQFGWFKNASAGNLVFSKANYLESLNIRNDQHIPSGDDYFLIKNLPTYKFEFSLEPNSKVHTYPVKDWKALFSQRKRWSSKLVTKPQVGLTFLWALAWVFCLLIIFSGILSVISYHKLFIIYFVYALIIKFISDFTLIIIVKQKLQISSNENPIIQELIHIIYVFVAGILAIIPFQYKWKKRSS